ncbi:MAG TPA: phosphopantothenoylcysteine decarboxylase [Anaerovoracaceae bacterium]|nr:phosphopantothenoylcysteine decarboxylase [Anaerovoracaceae bacterium]
MGKNLKNILITGGPTNEYIDEVMKITNMSTGSLSLKLAEHFLKTGYRVSLILTNSINTDKLKSIDASSKMLKIIPVETTEEMLEAIEAESKSAHFDALIHASAVADYKAAFSFLLEDLAEELFNHICEFESPQDILKLMENPSCKLDDSSKISSYQKNLTVKLGLTPKVIARLREWFPDTLLIGCKLLENVSKEELYETAVKLCVKNNMDYILANDLADLRAGLQARYLVSKDGFTGEILENPENIFEFVNDKLED